MTDMNKKQLQLWVEFWHKRAMMQEEMIWIGCNPDNPEMFKRQAEEGFRLMGKMSLLVKEYLEKIEKAKTLNRENE